MKNIGIQQEDLFLKSKGITDSNSKCRYYLKDLNFMTWVLKNYKTPFLGWKSNYYFLRVLRIKYFSMNKRRKNEKKK